MLFKLFHCLALCGLCCNLFPASACVSCFVDACGLSVCATLVSILECLLHGVLL